MNVFLQIGRSYAANSDPTPALPEGEEVELLFFSLPFGEGRGGVLTLSTNGSQLSC